MATSTAASDVVRGLGVLTTFWKKVEGAIREAGGNDEHIARLAKDDSNSAIKQFAEMIVNGAIGGNYSFRDQIRAGRYDYTYGLADNPEKIKGQSFHSVTSETQLDHPAKRLTTQQVLEQGELNELGQPRLAQHDGVQSGQLALFAAREQGLREELRQLDVDRLTPLDALTRLHALVALARKED